MNKTLYYLPLEPYIERYTWFMSSKEGWAEQHFKKHGVNFVRIEGNPLTNQINSGKVLDANGRSYYALTQTAALIEKINSGEVKDGDVIYVEDFWHPGIEALFYIRGLTGINFKIGTFLHAQSVDNSDFCYKMRHWMRGIEQGYGHQYDFIFVTSAILRQLCLDAGIGREDNIFNVGLPYNSIRLLEQLNDIGFEPQQKERYVIFSSRFDSEKNPMFFLQLVRECPDIQFVLVNPRKDKITNDPGICEELEKTLQECDNLKVISTKNKLDYYNALSKAKVQFNCANQDWVSWTLLEAVTFKCNPLYPIWKDFPVELNNNQKYLYGYLDIEAAKAKLYNLIDKEFDSAELDYIVEKHDNSWPTYLKIMGLI